MLRAQTLLIPRDVRTVTTVVLKKQLTALNIEANIGGQQCGEALLSAMSRAPIEHRLPCR
jgi:hypothetical protein